jgi:hypothetical protein
MTHSIPAFLNVEARNGTWRCFKGELASLMVSETVPCVRTLRLKVKREGYTRLGGL